VTCWWLAFGVSLKSMIIFNLFYQKEADGQAPAVDYRDAISPGAEGFLNFSVTTL
jgi:hypothetical protein